MKFFDKYAITSTSIIPMIHDENEFMTIRRQLLDENSAYENQHAASVARMYNYDNIPSNIDPLVKEKLIKRKEKGNAIILHYTYETGFVDFGRKIHQLWDNTFKNTTIETKKLIVGTRNNPNLSKELIRRNPFKKQKHKEPNSTLTTTEQ